MKTPHGGLWALASSCLLASPCAAGLLAYYSFDSDFTDGSGNGNDLAVGAGTPAISATAGEHQFGGGALDLNSTTGDQHYLNLGTGLSFGSGDAWSVAFWARHRPGNDGRVGMIVGDLTSSDFIWIPRDGAVDGVRFRNSAGADADYTTPPAGVEPAGVYHHWAVIADGAGNIEVYYDNASLGSQPITTSLDITSVGQGFNQNTQSMNGQIDELYIYDEAIDAAKVNDLFTGNTGPDTTPPTLSGEDMIDDQSGGPVVAGTEVTYTVTFSEDMDDLTVDGSDFGNAGSATFTIGAVTETSPGVFSVEITPTGAGSLQLEVLAGAVLDDAAGNPLDTASAIVAGGTITVQAGFDPAAVKMIRVFLLGGQSNADGRADPSGLPTSPVNLQQPQEDVDFYEGSLTTLRPVGGQFGPEITWGRCLADTLGDGLTTRVAILKSAAGGTSLEVDWKPGGDATTAGDGGRYVTFQNTVTAGLAALASAYPNATLSIEGMLWVQGERDAKGGFENNYETNLTNFIADVRLTYGAELPFIISRLSIDQTNIPATPLGIVRDAQSAVAAADPLAALVDTDGFGILADNLHFDALGQQQIGNASCLQTLNFYPFLSAPVLGEGTGGDLDLVLQDAFPGFLYTLFANPGLDPVGWSEIDAKTASSPVVTFSVTPPPGAVRHFYRIGRSLP